jgi:hypothetical protein
MTPGTDDETRRFVWALAGVMLAVALAASIRLSEPWPPLPALPRAPEHSGAVEASPPVEASDLLATPRTLPAPPIIRDATRHVPPVRPARERYLRDATQDDEVPPLGRRALEGVITTPVVANPPLAARTVINAGGVPPAVTLPGPVVMERDRRDGSLGAALSSAGTRMGRAFRGVGRSFRRGF